MSYLITAIGAILILAVLFDTFEVIILPRQVTRRIRFTRIFYRTTWIPWAAVAERLGRRREASLGAYGPFSLLLLLSLWAFGLILGFALIHYGSGSRLNTTESINFLTDLYLSATTFFTLGLGDVTPATVHSRIFVALEAGLGFGFLGMVISYLPVLYGAFAQREVSISLLDARAGSPPTAYELLKRYGDHDGTRPGGHGDDLEQFLREWERWSAELLESHLSYPVLAYYRSQHSNQSWLSALSCILDSCSVILVGLKSGPVRQARLTFAMARHAVIDLCQVFDTPPRLGECESRLLPEQQDAIVKALQKGGLGQKRKADWDKELKELRSLYEPYIAALSAHFRLKLPPWAHEKSIHDNWQSTPWKEITGRELPRIKDTDHF
ncbi:MAG: two pore domain potassium channel family protein [Leptospiraceae bacterium]|nr:two pore domain potassium channel family protein [Leptospiraceae bacterium]